MSDPAAALKPVLTTEGWELLNSLPAYDDTTATELNLQLRKRGWPPQTVAAVLTQLRLRRDADTKFGEFAARMMFTDHGLQQSTRLPVAAHHAGRFRQAGVDHVIDLACGLGADALAFASAGMQVTAVEADETTAAAATVNLMPFPEAEVVHTTAQAFAKEHGLLPIRAEDGNSAEDRLHHLPGHGLWLDPARRQTSQTSRPERILDPEQFSPPLSFVTALAATGMPVGAKFGPGIPHDLVPADCEAEWVSVDGELVEVALWFNELARPGVRRAGLVMSSLEVGGPSVSSVELTSAAQFGDSPTAEPAGVGGLRGILYEPDPAVIRAGLVSDLAQQLGGWLLDEHIAYFCADEPVREAAAAAARGYRVLEVMDFSPKALKHWCAEHQVSSVEIKKRGVDVVPETLRRQILPKRPTGPKHHLTVVITRVGDQRVAAVVEPLPRPSGAAA